MMQKTHCFPLHEQTYSCDGRLRMNKSIHYPSRIVVWKCSLYQSTGWCSVDRTLSIMPCCFNELGTSRSGNTSNEEMDDVGTPGDKDQNL